MKSPPFWLLLAGFGVILLLGDSVDAWNRHFFNRYTRNWLKRNNLDGSVGDLGGAGVVANSPQIDDFNALFGGRAKDVSLHGNGAGAETGAGMGMGMAIGVGGAGGVRSNNFANGYVGGAGEVEGGGLTGFAVGAGYDFDTVGGFGVQQQPEIYGIVEPLIEDTPCAERACQVNDDCCPTGVCVNTYGEGKCIYVYGRKRDLCHRNSDCELGMSCLKSVAGNLMCQPSATAIHLLNNIGNGNGNPGSVGGGVGGVASIIDASGSAANVGGNNAIGLNVAGTNIVPKLPLNVKQFGEDCVSSSDCNVTKGLCCQLQRTHHRIRPRKLCAYFRDPFTCIDIMPTENEEVRDSRFLTPFSQHRM